MFRQGLFADEEQSTTTEFPESAACDFTFFFRQMYFRRLGVHNTSEIYTKCITIKPFLLFNHKNIGNIYEIL